MQRSNSIRKRTHERTHTHTHTHNIPTHDGLYMLGARTHSRTHAAGLKAEGRLAAGTFESAQQAAMSKVSRCIYRTHAIVTRTLTLLRMHNKLRKEINEVRGTTYVCVRQSCHAQRHIYKSSTRVAQELDGWSGAEIAGVVRSATARAVQRAIDADTNPSQEMVKSPTWSLNIDDVQRGIVEVEQGRRPGIQTALWIRKMSATLQNALSYSSERGEFRC
jgi:hypothetical protein